MLQSLNWQDLATRRRHSRLLMLHRIHTGLVDIDTAEYVSANPRARGLRFLQKSAPHPVLRNSLFIRGTSEWNKLPYSVTLATSPEDLEHQLCGLAELD